MPIGRPGWPEFAFWTASMDSVRIVSMHSWSMSLTLIRLVSMAVADLHCLVEIPKGSRNKYEWDEELKAIKLDRFLFSSVVYPTDYGFIPDTCGEDGDPLDAMVCVSEPTFPGCVIPVKVIALFRMRDDKGVDDKVCCVPLSDPNWNHMETLDDLPQPLRDEISHFYSIYKQPEGKHVMVDGWYSREEALTTIDEARERRAQMNAAG
jgi:inorganic pyrophosphatase